MFDIKFYKTTVKRYKSINICSRIVFETIFHGNDRNMTYEKEFHYEEKDFVSDLFFFLIYLFIYLFIY